MSTGIRKITAFFSAGFRAALSALPQRFQNLPTSQQGDERTELLAGMPPAPKIHREGKPR